MITRSKHLVLWLILGILVVVNVFFATAYFWQASQAQAMQTQVQKQRTNVKVVHFLNLFIQKVLRSDKEISFEDRLLLENAVRDINDPDILKNWEKFTAGTTEVQIQQGVKDLLSALVNKINY